MSINGIEDLSSTARDLALTMENDGDMYRAYFLPVAKRLQQQWLLNQFSLTSGIRIMRRAVTQVARQYRLRHGRMSDAPYASSELDQVAEYLCVCLVAEWRLGNLL